VDQGLAHADAAQYKFAMTTNEFCESSGLAPRELRRWLETGLLEAETIGIPGGGHRYEFAPGQLERARVLNALHRKGVSLGQLVAADLAFDAGQAYVCLRRARAAGLPGCHGGDRHRGAGETPMLGCRSGRDPHG
jgi:hypothetical protein